ncbi:hypothetical protein H0O02_04565, partial [Candidatus Micrarchaeota archaeon]|nr:hypothetical protein [Candidatus Micrarchaeota archaeon]
MANAITGKKATVAVFSILLLISLSFSQYSTTPTEPKKAITDLFYSVQAVLIMLMVTFVIIAAGGYLFGQMFGAEMRAKI